MTVLRKSFYIHWSAGRSPRVHEVNPGRDPSTNLSISLMAEPSTLIPNLNEIMEEHAQLEGEVHLEPTGEVHLETTEENRPSEQPEVQPVVRQRKRKGKERRQEEEEDEFVSEEAHSLWKKHYAGKGFIGERGFSQLISPFKELIEQRGWGKFC